MRTYTRIDPVERFWAKVNKTGDCWVWTAGVNAYGYGQFNPTWGHPVLAHRYAWSLAHGQIPSGFSILHHCDNRRCVNLDHLWMGTHSDNTADMIAKGRQHFVTNRRLHEGDIAAIRVAAQDGIRQSVIGQWFGVDPSHISRLVRGERQHWRGR